MLPAVDRAVVLARDAFAAWSSTPAHKRSAILRRAAELIETRKQEIATLIAREAGKAWKYAIGEVARSVETFTFAAEEAKRIHGETVPMDASVFGEKRVGFYTRVPLGVVSAITPFNFPLNLVAHKVGPALAAGNTVVLKPAEENAAHRRSHGGVFPRGRSARRCARARPRRRADDG
jgi:acyl-CoA reductase-like NAD-dependent aldehyde dehydrogenase